MRNAKQEVEHRPAKSAREWGSITHPQNEVAFSASSGFALPGAPAGSEKNTVSGDALFPAGNGFLHSSRWSPFCIFL